MEHNLNNLSKLKSITLTDAERGIIRAHVAHLISTTPIPVKSPYTTLFQKGVQHGLRIALSSFVFIVFIGGTVSAVADNALPGDPLYTFKLNVNEEVKGLFQKTPAEKVAWRQSQIENRVQEIKTLAASKTLTKAKQATVQKAIDSHLKEFSEDLTTLSDTAPTAALSATATLEDTLKEGKLAIEQTDNTDPAATEEALMTVDGTIKKVSNQEVKIIAKELDAINTAVTNTTTSATLTPPGTPVAP